MAYRPSRNNYSERFIERLDREAALGDYGTGNAEFDVKMMELNSKRPKEQDFTSVYGAEEVVDDLREVKRIEEGPWYQKVRPEGATLVEAVIAYGIAKRGWLGPKAKVHLTSKYDDVKRGTDMLVEVPHPDSTPEKRMSLGMAIDVTASSDSGVIEDKIAKSIQRLDYGNRSRGNPGGQLTTLKYMFESHPNPKFDKSKRKYNHYILALDGSQAKELARQFCQHEEVEDKSYLELEAQIKTIYLLRHQAYLQLGEAMDRYCGFGQHVLSDYRRLPQKSKDDFGKLFDFVSSNLPAIEKHLKEVWTRKSFDKRSNQERVFEENNSDIFISIKKNLTAIKYLEDLLASITENKKEAATILAGAKRDSFIDDPGARHLLSFGRRELRDFSRSLHLPRAAGNG